ncbi:hypothetical protein PV327_002937 [Microctonus hyperodae]|uniref:Dehydrogenase/reductase SDR family member 11 n=1 Tax=Microctonus hyperodae TaxID=165561 RepID=A0AA39G2Y9_MICHY|nr:hypothetical protein PV327_002937 [Microctonus hyperodae]
MPIVRWGGKIAVVTGAGSGIGAAITHILLRNRINVFGFDIETNGFETIKTKISGISNVGFFQGLKCDVSREYDICTAFDVVKKKFGGVDIMVNNAAVVDYSRVIDSNRKSFERLVNTNVLAVATCTRIAVESMRERGVEGHIFNINSVLGHEIPLQGFSEEKGLNGFNIYPSTKHATVALTHTVRRELAASKLSIKITSISPGLTKTNLAKRANFGNFFDGIPALEPEDIAEALLYALAMKPEVQITELTIRRTGES